MKLIGARVQNYRSVEDSQKWDIGALTCLVGKNEAGKTALLAALRGLRSTSDFSNDETRDYPRRFATRFNERHPSGFAEVIRTWWQVRKEDREAVEKRFGPGVLKSTEIQAHYGFRYKGDLRLWDIEIDEGKCLQHLVAKHALDETERGVLHAATNAQTAVAALTTLATRTPKQEALLQEVKQCRDTKFTLAAIDILDARMPRFFYTSHFERMSGEISIEQLEKDRAAKTVSPGDKIFLDFLDYAGTSLEELKKVNKREELKARLEAAGNDITDEIFQFWSQNTALEVIIDFDSGKPGDRPPFNAGTIAQVRIRNNNHKATLPLSERSAGFVWFFSFLAQFKQLKKTAGNAILLLDEPGLTLHGKAQGDLLRYIEERLLPQHQVIYTTHSPFMVPVGRLADVRIVGDVIERDGKGRTTVKGTKVRSDVLAVDDDTLFPLQGALGYEITQSLFIGPNTLLVEGSSDIVYLDVLSQALRKRGLKALRKEWTLSPSGGIDRIAPFVRLFRGNDLNVAVLSDLAKGDKRKVEDLKKAEILKAGHFSTVADFLAQSEADIEDLFDIRLFVKMLNEAYTVPASHTVTVRSLTDADPGTTRIVKKAEALFRLMPSSVPEFGHYTAAEYLMRNPTLLDGDAPEVLETLSRAERVFAAYNGLLP